MIESEEDAYELLSKLYETQRNLDTIHLRCDKMDVKALLNIYKDNIFINFPNLKELFMLSKFHLNEYIRITRLDEEKKN